MATRVSAATITSFTLYPWDFNVGDIFSYAGETYYVNAPSTKVFALAIRKSDKASLKVRISSLRLSKDDIRPATEEEKAEFAPVIEEKKGDPRIRRGAPVRIKDPKQALKYGYAGDTIFIVVNETKRMTLIPLGGLEANQQGLLFPASLLEYAPVVAAS